MPTRITIVGPGAIGQLFGSALVTSGCDVTFLARSARRAARLTDRGLAKCPLHHDRIEDPPSRGSVAEP